MALIIMAAFDGSGANREKKRPISKKKGAPGGCPTSNLKAAAINSPQSQKLEVGSMVSKYTIAAMAKANQPIKLLYKLNFFIIEKLMIFG
jgi:hypothetical protein